MAEVFGEWRRGASRCGGALVLWLRDLEPGAGWGLLDSAGEPKVAYHHLRRALAPVAVWTTDEGLGGIAVHVANDGPSRCARRLRVALYRDFEQRVGEASERARARPRTARCERDVEELLGHFVDVSWAYRFGPAGAGPDRREPRASATSCSRSRFRFPAGRPGGAEAAARIGLQARASAAPGGRRRPAVIAAAASPTACACTSRASSPATTASRSSREVRARCCSGRAARPWKASGAVTALNLQGRVAIEFGPGP